MSLSTVLRSAMDSLLDTTPPPPPPPPVPSTPPPHLSTPSLPTPPPPLPATPPPPSPPPPVTSALQFLTGARGGRQATYNGYTYSCANRKTAKVQHWAVGLQGPHPVYPSLHRTPDNNPRETSCSGGGDPTLPRSIPPDNRFTDTEHGRYCGTSLVSHPVTSRSHRIASPQPLYSDTTLVPRTLLAADKEERENDTHAPRSCHISNV